MDSAPIEVVISKLRKPVRNEHRTRNIRVVAKTSPSEFLPVVANTNARSLFPKLNSLKVEMIDGGIDICTVTEVWGKEDDVTQTSATLNLLEEEGISSIIKCRKGKRGGGIGVFVGAGFYITELCYKIPKNVELCWTMVRKRDRLLNQKFIVGIFYIPPNARKATKETLKETIIANLSDIFVEQKNCTIFLTGDRNTFDTDFIKHSVPGMSQRVLTPTRKHKILDVIYTNSPYYKQASIRNPLKNDGESGAQSDHSIAIIHPNDNGTQPTKKKIVKRRILKESSIQNMGKWMTTQSWKTFSEIRSPETMETIYREDMGNAIEKFFPMKKYAIHHSQHPWTSKEMVEEKKKRMAEYKRHGKSARYKELVKSFNLEKKIALQKYVDKNVNAAIKPNPGKAFRALQKLSEPPTSIFEDNSVMIPAFENKSDQQIADKLAEYFSKISNEYQPFSICKLPNRVVEKLESQIAPDTLPKIEEFQVFNIIKKMNIPDSTVEGDIPKKILKTFTAEISKPLAMIYNGIIRTQIYPSQWKKETVIPLSKCSIPETMDDLQNIGLTAMASKIFEKFLESLIHQQITGSDNSQFGATKNKSTLQYLMLLINKITSGWEKQEASILLMVDFSKAFNRIDHPRLITILSDFGIQPFLLKIIISYLSGRSMRVKFRETMSEEKELNGGSCQGTILGPLFFVIYVAAIGQDNIDPNNQHQMLHFQDRVQGLLLRLKYVDDLSILENLNLPTKTFLLPPPIFPTVPNFRERTGHALDHSKCELVQEMKRLVDFTKQNRMVLNKKKTQVALFNRSKTIDFPPLFEVDGTVLDYTEKFKLLGVDFDTQLSFTDQVDKMVNKAKSKLWIIKRLVNNMVPVNLIVLVYITRVRSILEYAAPVFSGFLTIQQEMKIECVQKLFLMTIFGFHNLSYEALCKKANVEPLAKRRKMLCYSFVKKEIKSKDSLFVKAQRTVTRRGGKDLLFVPQAKSESHFKSPLVYLARLFNSKS